MRTPNIVVLIPCLVIGVHVTSAQAANWELRRQTTSNACHVQQSDSQPKLGELVGTYGSRKEACQEAKRQYDSSMASPKKCWTYGGGTKSSCKSDGVDL